MDKLGPMCRGVEDCALVLEAIRGSDGKDGSVVDAPFNWDPSIDATKLRVGYVRSLFRKRNADAQDHDNGTLDKLRELGVELIPIELPEFPVGALSFILSAEAAAAFDDLTRSGEDAELVRQIEMAWPNRFRLSRLIPAVEYLQANRARTLLMKKKAQLFEKVDAYVIPSFGGGDLLSTNLTGHPALCLPNGFRGASQPTSITFVGDLFGEAELLALGKIYQDATDFHHRHPALDFDG